MSDLQDVEHAPWRRGDWTGELVSIDGCEAHDFTKDDVARLVAYGDTGHGWDGDAAGIAELKDGRFVSWETWWGPTGSGFYCDAYGGDTDVGFAKTAHAARAWLSEKARELLGEVTL
jgi:hypothetical protein